MLSVPIITRAVPDERLELPGERRASSSLVFAVVGATLALAGLGFGVLALVLP